uniref:MANSC domain-containing protein n=1 Tax=Glossina brevipalpis TaxID=37001 RepID=A0A1A9WZX2_9MUSC
MKQSSNTTITIVFLILASNIGGFNASSEEANQGVSKQNRENNTRKKIDAHRLTKRMDLELCLGQFDIHQNTIIRTGESQAIGGKYLQGLELDTIEECQRLCCETESCDVYIFENKNNGYCYLFECGSPENFHCKFTRHANYTSAVLTPIERNANEVITPRPSVSPTQNVISKISQQEWELTNLKLKQKAHEKISEFSQPTKSTSSVINTDTEGIKADAVNNGQTMDSNSGNILQKSFNVTQNCGRFQFACHSGECIAVYNACDGIPQCDDGSDEGIECSNASNNAGVAGAVAGSKLGPKNADINTKPSYVATRYQPSAIQQEIAQQQLRNMQQQHQQPFNTLDLKHSVNNREDANAWENRKVLLSPQQVKGSNGENQDKPNTGTQILYNTPSKPNEETFTAYVNNKSNNNAAQSSTLEESGLYALQAPIYHPTTHDHIMPPINSNWHQQATITRQQSNQQTQLNLSEQQQQAPVISQEPNYMQQPRKAVILQDEPQTKISSLNGLTTQDKSPLMSGPNELNSVDKDTKVARENLVENADEYEDDEDKSTEPPKKKPHKHRKSKSKSLKNMEYTVEKFQTQSETTVAVHRNTPAITPVHEQYKTIHENLALEFRDHDGLSDRPQSAVLSLTLGVLITAALAILIGCRLRTVGRRARRLGGKTPYAHEADFLVNGMYL